jgi:hypothetical protein
MTVYVGNIYHGHTVLSVFVEKYNRHTFCLRDQMFPWLQQGQALACFDGRVANKEQAFVQ